jgi:hypothetical protein
MKLVVTLGSALERRYGAEGAASVIGALDRYAARTGSILAVLDDRRAMARLGLEFVPASAVGAITSVIRQARNTFSVDGLVLVGGDHIVPYWQLANPVVNRRVDPDPIVLSDSPYGATVDSLDAYLAPDLPVGRIPDPAPGNTAAFIAVIDGLGTKRPDNLELRGSTSFVNREWTPASAEIVRLLAQPVVQREAPGFELDDTRRSDTARRHLYFNLHGFKDDRAWKAFDPVRGQFFSVVTPKSFHREHVKGTIVFVENCYGALTVSKNATTSCALRLMEQGSSAVIGATGLAFGSHMHPSFALENADLLARLFFESLASGLTVGSALVRARQVYKNDATVPRSNVFKQKTLLQFTLLGDLSAN